MTNAVTVYGSSNESVVVYQSEDGTLKLDVQLKEESVWLTQEQIATLFGTQRPAITKHLNNIFNSGELDRTSTCSILEHMGNDGKQRYVTKYYNLDVILAVGYRVNSRNATFFRGKMTFLGIYIPVDTCCHYQFCLLSKCGIAAFH